MNQAWLTGVFVLANNQPEASAPAATAAPTAKAAVPVPGEGGGTATTPLGPGGTGAPGAAPAAGNPMGSMFWILPVMLVVMILMSTLSGRKEKKRRAELISGIRKHDKVQMIGGIIGTVTELTDDEVVVKVEEGRIRFNKSSVQGVLTANRAKGDSSIAEVKSESHATVG